MKRSNLKKLFVKVGFTLFLLLTAFAVMGPTNVKALIEAVCTPTPKHQPTKTATPSRTPRPTDDGDCDKDDKCPPTPTKTSTATTTPTSSSTHTATATLTQTPPPPTQTTTATPVTPVVTDTPVQPGKKWFSVEVSSYCDGTWGMKVTDYKGKNQGKIVTFAPADSVSAPFLAGQTVQSVTFTGTWPDGTTLTKTFTVKPKSGCPVVTTTSTPAETASIATAVTSEATTSCSCCCPNPVVLTWNEESDGSWLIPMYLDLRDKGACVTITLDIPDNADWAADASRQVTTLVTQEYQK